MKTIEQIQIIDHGIEWSAFFQGCGTTFTKFDSVATGIGDTPAEAISDALEQIASIESEEVLAAIELLLANELGANWESSARFQSPSAYAEALADSGAAAENVNLRFRPYCSLDSEDIETGADLAEARQSAADVIRARRAAGYAVKILERGARWEVLEPDDCVMIPDDCGILILDDQTADDPELDDWPHYHISIRY